EGKSTTIANLGVALARSGRRVALVDLDLRRPYLNRFFRVSSGLGITDVVLGRIELADALRPVFIPNPDGRPSGGTDQNGPVPSRSGSSNGRRQVDGVLNVLPAGTIPPDAGELVATEGLSKVLAAL